MRASFLIVIGALALTTTAHADEDDGPRWGLRGYSTQRWMGDASAAALTTDTLTGGGLAIERKLLAVPVPGPFGPAAISTELSWDAGSVDGTTFQQLDNHISTWSVNAGARARVPLLSWVHLQGRASVGAGRTTVRIADMATGAAISDRSMTTVAQTGIGVGIMPRLQQGKAFRIGFELELGYQTATSTGVRAYPENRPEPELTIPASYAMLGDVDLDGWTLRFGAGFAF
jgi:hypothetical protein